MTHLPLTEGQRRVDAPGKWLVGTRRITPLSRLSARRDATTLRIHDGKLLTTDGPFVETKEQIGGFILIDARDLNEAIELAAKIRPRAWEVSRYGRSRRWTSRGEPTLRALGALGPDRST